MVTFRSSIKKLACIAVPSLLVAGLLTDIGCHLYETLKSDTTGSFPPSWVFYGLPWGISLFIVFADLWLMASNTGRQLQIGRATVEYQVRNRQVFRSPWSEVVYVRPNPERKRFRTLVLSTPRHHLVVEEFFFPEFDALVRAIETARKS